MMNQQSYMYFLVEEWKQSDLTKAEFSALKSMSYHQFNYWLKKHNKDNSSGSPKSEVSFFSVAEHSNKEKKQSVSKLRGSKTMQINLPGGILITIYK